MKKTGLRFLKYALAGVLLLPLIGKGVFAEDVNRIQDILDDKDFTITFKLPGNLEKAETDQFDGTDSAHSHPLTVTLYKIAGAEKEDGYDTYHYTAVSGLKINDKDVDLTKYKADEGKLGLSDLEKDDWKDLAAQISKTSLSGGQDQLYKPTGAKFEKLEAGLYLVVAHDADHKTLKEDEKYLGVARTDLYEYHFLPQLISVPSPDNVTGGTTPWEMDLVTEEAGFDDFEGPEMKTSDAAEGGWLKDLEVMLKPERKLMFSNLILEKLVTRYDNRGPATFVFHVVGTKDGKDVYRNYVTISFTKAGVQQRIIEHLPVGATFTVTEVDTVGYTLDETNSSKGSGSNSADILPAPNKGTVLTKENTAWVQFKNSYGNDVPHGYGIENSFEYDDKDDSWPYPEVIQPGSSGTSGTTETAAGGGEN